MVVMLPSELSLFLLPNWPRLPVGWKAHAVNVYLVMIYQLDESLLPVMFTTDHIHEVAQHHQGVINLSQTPVAIGQVLQALDQCRFAMAWQYRGFYKVAVPQPRMVGA